jgi:peptide/nickel transport system permease protein
VRGFILARLGQAVVVIAAVATLTFGLSRLAPGDPFLAFDDARLTEQERAAMRTDWGYDRPLVEQYGRWLGNLAAGDLGWSHSRSRPVSEVLAAAVPNTLLLTLPAVLLGLLGGVAFGTWKAVRHGRFTTRAADAFTLAFVSVPDFIVAVAVLSIAGIELNWFPTSGMIDVVNHDSMSIVGRMGDIATHMVLPVGTLAIIIAAAVSRYHRAAMLSVLQSDHLRTARAKGASERRVIMRHALPNALGPVIAIAGLLAPTVFGGAVFVEKVFGWPGMGLTVVDAVTGRDYALVQATVLIGTVLVVASAIVADIVAVMVNPRTRIDL